MNSNKARITYRLDPNREPRSMDKEAREKTGTVIPLYEEEYQVEEQLEPARKDRVQEIRDYQLLNQTTTDYGAWNSPYDAETQRIEELIRESNAKHGRSREESGERSYRPLPEEELRYDAQTGYFEREPETSYRRVDEEWTGPSVSGPRYVRHSRPPWMKISVSVAGAAVTGVLLGFFVLSLFSGDGMDLKGDKAPTGLETAQGTGQPDAKPVGAAVQKDAAGTAGTGASAATGKETAFSYAGKAYTILQYGSFGGAQGADTAKSELTKKGFAAASEVVDDKYFVYAGMSMDRNSALALTQQLKDDKVDYYVKTYQVPAISQIRWNGAAANLKSYLEQSDKMIQSLTQLTLLHLEEAKPTAMDDSTLQSVKTAHTAWVQAATTISSEAGEDNKPLLQRMTNAMNSAKTSLDEYKKNPSKPMLWNAQTYLMQFVLAQKELLDRLKVQ